VIAEAGRLKTGSFSRAGEVDYVLLCANPVSHMQNVIVAKPAIFA
jgi:hypothetical protein